MSVSFGDCVLSEQFSSFSHIPRVVQPLPLIPEHSTLQKRNHECINTSLPYPLSLSRATAHLLTVCGLASSGRPYRWSQTTWVCNCLFGALPSVPLGMYSGAELPCKIFILKFSGNLHAVSTAVAPFYIPARGVQGFSLLHILSLVFCFLFL